jgi:hypothetical protein
MQSHFWVGSFCYCIFNGREYFPRETIAASDIVTLVNDLGNRISDKSWMLYLLEIFNAQNATCELNLICQFDGQNYFEAIFQGRNQYRFKQVLPVLNHSYQRQIIMNQSDGIISYLLTDKMTNQSEIFNLSIANNKNNNNNHRKRFNRFDFAISNQFTGVEWWNKVGNVPYPIRFHVQVSQLLYGRKDAASEDASSILFSPYNALSSDSDRLAKQYPISFANSRVKEDDGCICYDMSDGVCTNGIRFSAWRV